MLIVISNPNPVANEANLINQLFDEGLELFHLRKPDYSKDEIEQLMLEINSKHHTKLVFHQYHNLANYYGVNRLHFTAANKSNLSELDIVNLKLNHFFISTSVHSFEEYENLSDSFDYAFLSPVFDSISKEGYKAANFELDLDLIKKRHTKLIALGGITKSNLTLAINLGFAGVAVLGSIWKSENPIEQFNNLKTYAA